MGADELGAGGLRSREVEEQCCCIKGFLGTENVKRLVEDTEKMPHVKSNSSS
jgi:hypothetical protein